MKRMVLQPLAQIVRVQRGRRQRQHQAAVATPTTPPLPEAPPANIVEEEHEHEHIGSYCLWCEARSPANQCSRPSHGSLPINYLASNVDARVHFGDQLFFRPIGVEECF